MAILENEVEIEGDWKIYCAEYTYLSLKYLKSRSKVKNKTVMKKQTYNNYMNAGRRMSKCVQAHPYIFHLFFE